MLDDDLDSAESTEELIGIILEYLGSISDVEQVNEWRGELFNSDVDYTNREAVMDWFENIRKRHGPRLVGYESCTKHLPLVLATADSLPYFGTLIKCGWCTRWA